MWQPCGNHPHGKNSRFLRWQHGCQISCSCAAATFWLVVSFADTFLCRRIFLTKPKKNMALPCQKILRFSMILPENLSHVPNLPSNLQGPHQSPHPGRGLPGASHSANCQALPDLPGASPPTHRQPCHHIALAARKVVDSGELKPCLVINSGSLRWFAERFLEVWFFLRMFETASSAHIHGLLKHRLELCPGHPWSTFTFQLSEVFGLPYQRCQEAGNVM